MAVVMDANGGTIQTESGLKYKSKLEYTWMPTSQTGSACLDSGIR